MGRRNTFLVLLVVLFAAGEVRGQSTQYTRKKKAAPAAVPAATAPGQAPAAPAPTGKDEKLDVSGLEEKYWSSQDTDFTVVQNRTYTKVGRVSLAVSAGFPANDSYNTGLLTSVAVNYYWSERSGIELNYTKYDFKDSKLVSDFLGQYGSGVRPDMNRDTQFIGVAYNWIPIYAKASLLGSKIMYFDFGVSPGIGITNYEQFVDTGNRSDSALGYTLDFTQQFFISKELAFRFDFKNKWVAERVLGYSNVSRGIEKRNDPIYSSYLVFGITYFF